MIDTHSHILPAVDDGSRNISESLAMLRLSVEDGVNVQVLTPHIPKNIYGSSFEALTIIFDNLKKIVKKEEIPIQLELAGEVTMSQEIITLAEADSIPFIGLWEDKKVFVMEFPLGQIPAGLINLVEWLTKKGLRPLIAHPERCADIQTNVDRIIPFIDGGCLLQITAGSLCGAFGNATFNTACKLLTLTQTPLIASDCHRLDMRPPGALQEAVKAAGDVIGTEAAMAAVTTFPGRILDGLKTVYKG